MVAPTQPAVGTIVVRLDGDLDVSTAPRARRVVSSALAAVAAEAARPGARRARLRARVVCDLDGLAVLAAAGRSMLLDLARQADALGVDLVLIASRGPARRTLELTGLHRATAWTADRTAVDDTSPVTAPDDLGEAS